MWKEDYGLLTVIPANESTKDHIKDIRKKIRF
jgi:hypothetical protein